jgi:hypothetical protein
VGGDVDQQDGLHEQQEDGRGAGAAEVAREGDGERDGGDDGQREEELRVGDGRDDAAQRRREPGSDLREHAAHEDGLLRVVEQEEHGHEPEETSRAGAGAGETAPHREMISGRGAVRSFRSTHMIFDGGRLAGSLARLTPAR